MHISILTRRGWPPYSQSVAAFCYPSAPYFRAGFARAARREAPTKEMDMNRKLYVGNLSSEATEEELRFNFSQAGNVLSVALIKDRMTGLNKGFGFVEMETEEGARKAIESFNGGELHGKVIVVSEAKPPKDRPTGGGFGRDRQGGFGRGPGRPGGGGRRY